MAPCPTGQAEKKALDEAPKPGSKRRRVEEDAVIPCAVCGDKASGVHYQVHTCEGCKVRKPYSIAVFSLLSHIFIA